VSAFIFVVLEKVPDKWDLLNREQVWIDALNAVTDGYNCTPTAGSCLGNIHPPETRAKISAKKRGIKLSAAHRAAIGNAIRNNGVKRVVSEEGRKKLSAARTGRPNPKLKGRIITESQRTAIRAKLTGRTLSDDHAKNIREALKAKAARGECDYVFRAAAARKALSPERRSEIIRKSWETRRAKAAAIVAHP
jgi:group I intron endonuclease